MNNKTELKWTKMIFQRKTKQIQFIWEKDKQNIKNITMKVEKWIRKLLERSIRCYMSAISLNDFNTMIYDKRMLMQSSHSFGSMLFVFQ